MKRKIGIAIPVRMDSSRFPRKPFAQILNMPMIQHVWERACLTENRHEVVIITPDEEIYHFMKELGANTLLSKLDHPNGTSRVAEFADILAWDNYVILQGDEPLILPSHLDTLINFVRLSPSKFINVISDLKMEDLENTNVVKCLVNKGDEVTFMFRRNPLQASTKRIPAMFAKVNGLYSISSEMLGLYKEMKPQMLEISESIEQFRYIENHIPIKGLKIIREDYSVNTKEELDTVLKVLKSDPVQIGITNEYRDRR